MGRGRHEKGKKGPDTRVAQLSPEFAELLDAQTNLPKDIKKYNTAAKPLKPTDTIEDLLKEVFKKYNVPGSLLGKMATRIQNQMGAAALDEYKKSNAKWQIKEGALIFITTEQHNYKLLIASPSESAGSEKTGTGSTEVAGERPGDSTEKLTEIGLLSSHKYDLGVHDGADSAPAKAVRFAGGFDKTRFKKDKLREQTWYEATGSSAKILMDIYKTNPNRFDAKSKKLIESKKEILEKLATWTEFDPQKFYNDFEKRHRSEDILGSNGVYNILEGFKRILDMVDAPALTKAVELEINIVQGKHYDQRDERFAKSYELKSDATPEVARRSVIKKDRKQMKQLRRAVEGKPAKTKSKGESKPLHLKDIPGAPTGKIAPPTAKPERVQPAKPAEAPPPTPIVPAAPPPTPPAVPPTEAPAPKTDAAPEGTVDAAEKGRESMAIIAASKFTPAMKANFVLMNESQTGMGFALPNKVIVPVMWLDAGADRTSVQMLITVEDPATKKSFKITQYISDSRDEEEQNNFAAQLVLLYEDTKPVLKFYSALKDKLEDKAIYYTSKWTGTLEKAVIYYIYTAAGQILNGDIEILGDDKFRIKFSEGGGFTTEEFSLADPTLNVEKINSSIKKLYEEANQKEKQTVELAANLWKKYNIRFTYSKFDKFGETFAALQKIDTALQNVKSKDPDSFVYLGYVNTIHVTNNLIGNGVIKLVLDGKTDIRISSLINAAQIGDGLNTAINEIKGTHTTPPAKPASPAPSEIVPPAPTAQAAPEQPKETLVPPEREHVINALNARYPGATFKYWNQTTPAEWQTIKGNLTNIQTALDAVKVSNLIPASPILVGTERNSIGYVASIDSIGFNATLSDTTTMQTQIENGLIEKRKEDRKNKEGRFKVEASKLFEAKRFGEAARQYDAAYEASNNAYHLFWAGTSYFSNNEFESAFDRVGKYINEGAPNVFFAPPVVEKNTKDMALTIMEESIQKIYKIKIEKGKADVVALKMLFDALKVLNEGQYGEKLKNINVIRFVENPRANVLSEEGKNVIEISDSSGNILNVIKTRLDTLPNEQLNKEAPLATPKTFQDWEKQGDELLNTDAVGAINAYEQAVGLKTTNVATYERLALLYKQQKKYEDAIRVYKYLLENHPNLENTHYNLGFVYRNAGKFEESLEEYNKHLTTFPEDTDAFYGKGQTLEKLGRKEEAIQQYQKYIDKEKRPEKQKWIDHARENIEKLKK